MTHDKPDRPLFRSALCGIACCFLACPVKAEKERTAMPVGPRATHHWIMRPWEIRYFISVTDAWAISKKVASDWNSSAGHDDSLDWHDIFAPTGSVPIPSAAVRIDEQYSIVVMEFDEMGAVKTPHAYGGPLRGRINRLLYVTLSAGDGPADAQYDLGHWFTGLGDVSTHWAPALCDATEMPSPFSSTDTTYRYGPRFRPTAFSNTFGCREWAYQLYDDERPYIDVTSYTREGRPSRQRTAINDFIGWARFGDRKPVIGQHDGDWYCLHDCPDGAAPGPIADIRDWSRANGWPVPRPPTKAPTFPDPPARQGSYPR